MFGCFCWLELLKFNQICNFSKTNDNSSDIWSKKEHQAAAHRYIPAISQSMPKYDGHLTLPKTTKKFKECNFLLVGESNEKSILFWVRKRFEKEKMLSVKIHWQC